MPLADCSTGASGASSRRCDRKLMTRTPTIKQIRNAYALACAMDEPTFSIDFDVALRYIGVLLARVDLLEKEVRWLEGQREFRLDSA